MEISIIIPAYNEAKRITTTIKSVVDYLNNLVQDRYEIIIVLDGSKDNTLEVVTELAKKYNKIKIINNKINKGKGAAVKQGMLESKGDYVIFMDADNSTHIDELDKILPIMRQGIDVVVGSRDIIGSQVEIRQARYKEILGDLGNWWLQILLVGGIKDTQCGFKVLSGKVARHVFAKINMKGWSFDIELLALARYFGYSVKEMPVIWYNDESSHVKLKDYIQVLIDTVVIKYRLLTGYYK
ncbi:MAG: dolichyl-phosphate beta-glucosyltransferase [Candidatus Paceibacterota bacterium]